MESGLFVFCHFEGREVYPELVEGSPGEGAKLKDLIPLESGLFVFCHFEGREVYPELVEGSPGEGAVKPF